MTDKESSHMRAARRAAVWSQGFAAFCFLSALIGTAYLDRLTSVLLVLSTFLFGIVCRYSERYLKGDPGQSRFLFWLTVTGSFVFALVLARNLLVFALAWCGISLSLHQLLQFYRDRRGALIAARKKFLISRLGDAALVAALVLVQWEFGTWDFSAIFGAAARYREAGLENLPFEVSLVCGLLVFAALLKSAQFPFHSWLPDTMETPTPVSALMHAGVINAGGILILRLSPLISLSEAAMLVLSVAGAVTAVFASAVMLTQASVKRCLAFSTVAQMGFMMLECGLGAFPLALLHLVAHSLYKAHAFLSSGSVVHERNEDVGRGVHPAAFAVCLLAAVALSFRMGAPMLLNGIFALAVGQMLWSLPGRQVPLGLVLGALMSLVYIGLERAAGWVVQPVYRATGWPEAAILTTFFIAAVASTQLHRLARTSFGQRVYVHARNGFYCNTVANRITSALWPVKVAQEGI